MNYPKLASCSPADIEQALRKLGGFRLEKSSRKHLKITHNKTGKAWMVPRKTPIKRGLMWDFVRSYLQKELRLSEKEIFENLWC